MMEEKLPKGWEFQKIGDLSEQVNGKAFKPSDWSKKGTPIIRIQNLNNFKADFNYSEDFIDEKFHVNNGDLLFAWSGTPGTSFGAHIWNRGKAYLNQHIFKIKIKNDQLDQSYYYYALKITVEKFIVQAQGTAGLAHITKKKFENTGIPVPPLPEQQRIVAKLDALFGHLDSLREKLDRIPVLLKNFRQQVLIQAVTGELTKEWREGKGLGEWERVQLGKLGKWVGGGTPSKSEPAFWNNGEVLWITPKDMKSIFVSDSLDKITPDAVEKSSTKLVPSNSILIVTRSGILRRILPISLNTKEATVNQDLKVLIPKKEVYPKFLLYSLIGLEENIRISCMKSGTTVESIEFSDLKGYSLGIPTFKEQEEIVRKVEALFSLADKIESQYTSLKAKIDQLPQAILAKAFRGELVEQEVKEYVEEEIEGLMAAEPDIKKQY